MFLAIPDDPVRGMLLAIEGVAVGEAIQASNQEAIDRRLSEVK